MKLYTLLAQACSLLALSSGCQREHHDSIPLWPQGAPGSESRRREPETSGGWWVANVHHPSLTPFRPKLGRATGAAIIVIPGGGHERLVFGPEGVEPARFLAELGVTAFALKYRLAREPGSPYSIREHAQADAFRAIRWVRTHAAEYNVDPKRVGVMGWSAGGELASLASYGDASGNIEASDPIDRRSARPDFQVVIYPGPLGVPAKLPSDAPPAFFLAAADDEHAAEPVTRLFALYRAAGRPVELHFYERGGHGFNLGERSSIKAIQRWPARLAEWLDARGLAHSS